MGVKIMVDAEYFCEGSLSLGNRKGGVDTLVVHVAIDSEEPRDVLTRVVKEAEAGCFTLGAIRHAYPITIAANLNGSQLDLGNG